MPENTTQAEWHRAEMSAGEHEVRASGGSVTVTYPTIDATPTAESVNPVSSGGVAAALAGKQANLVYDAAPTPNSQNALTSGTIYTAIEEVREILNPGYTGTDKPVYVFRIDPAEDDPETAVSYAGANKNFTPATVTSLGGWENTFIGKKIRPAVVKDGYLNYWLNHENIFKKESGADAVLTGADGDCMAGIPTVYWKTSVATIGWITTTTPKLAIEIAFSEGQFDGGKARAHRFGDEATIAPWLFVGMFNGTVSSNKLRSVYSTSAKPTVSQTIDTFQTQAAAGGTGYSIETFNTLTLINILFVAAYKTLDTQTAIGQGLVGGSAAPTIGDTYRAKVGGGAYGTSSNTVPMRLFYMENRAGGLWNFIQGLMQDANNNLRLNHSNKNFITQNVSSPAFIDADWTTFSGHAQTTEGYIKSFLGADPAPFIPSALGGSSSTFATDYYWWNSGVRTCLSGGFWSNGAFCGVFSLHLPGAPSTSAAHIGARLQILSMGAAAAPA